SGARQAGVTKSGPEAVQARCPGGGAAAARRRPANGQIVQAPRGEVLGRRRGGATESGGRPKEAIGNQRPDCLFAGTSIALCGRGPPCEDGSQSNGRTDRCATPTSSRAASSWPPPRAPS